MIRCLIINLIIIIIIPISIYWIDYELHRKNHYLGPAQKAQFLAIIESGWYFSSINCKELWPEPLKSVQLGCLMSHSLN